MAYTMDTTFGTLLDDPRAKDVLEQYLPGVSTHPMIGMARGFTLSMLVSLPQANQFGLTKEKMQEILDQINKLGV